MEKTGSINRRELLVATGVALLGTTSLPVLAKTQEASPDVEPIPVAELPEPTDDGIDVPVLGIAFGSDEIVATTEVAAGTVRMLTAVPYEDFGSILFRIPDDQPDAIGQILAAVSQPEPEVPEWLRTTHFPGGVRTDYRYGTTAEGFVTLLPGTYGVIDFATGQGTTFLATGESVEAVSIPATVAVTALDSMTYNGLEGAVPAGRQLWQLTNAGEMAHNIHIFSTPEGTTADDILESFSSEEQSSDDGTSGGLMSTQTLSLGAVNHFYLDLEPGRHAAMCTESTDFSGPPHAFMGMIVTFDVA
ncbi:MAG: hypothetical protein AVDCRST_MAG43-2091 [uncultured Thermomicrobiales bacterium]|uniref:Uncharacterized protein n=1 Tax=uncultured Thermomicrobiales bacterium TaxID=1645740 RepID=A0A6J4V2J4_9BACT|nr:MAG: hypothetical protein AVDCRST_MAG43-2091 [uncultured Thermomicrobiales bacterium]